jgi:hypothetical protein
MMAAAPNVTDTVVEFVAQAMRDHVANRSGRGREWSRLNEAVRNNWRAEARVAIEAYRHAMSFARETCSREDADADRWRRMTAAALPVAGDTVVPYECVTRGDRVIGVRALPRGVTIRQAPASMPGLSLPQGDALFELVRNGRVVGHAQLPAATSWVRRASPSQGVVETNAAQQVRNSHDQPHGGLGQPNNVREGGPDAAPLEQERQPAPSMPLEPDIDQIEIFVDALFRYAREGTFVSLRSFYDDKDEPFIISPVAIGSNRSLLNKRAGEIARTCANAERPVVFCPPIVTFKNRKHAREVDLAQGLALSVECDEHPDRAREKLEKIIDPPTVEVRSGGTWSDPETGEVHDKRHLHWRLAKPAEDDDALKKLKRARNLAGELVGGDDSNKPAVHPIRWPGSWHRKRGPRLCRIETVDPDREIDLAIALAALEAACPQQTKLKNQAAEVEWSAGAEAEAWSALQQVPSHERRIWLKMGMALHSTGWESARAMWDRWSKTTPGKYSDDDQRRRGRALTGGTTA